MTFLQLEATRELIMRHFCPDCGPAWPELSRLQSTSDKNEIMYNVCLPLRDLIVTFLRPGLRKPTICFADILQSTSKLLIHTHPDYIFWSPLSHLSHFQYKLHNFLFFLVDISIVCGLEKLTIHHGTSISWHWLINSKNLHKFTRYFPIHLS